jgi:hypothetical protein
VRLREARGNGSELGHVESTLYGNDELHLPEENRCAGRRNCTRCTKKGGCIGRKNCTGWKTCTGRKTYTGGELQRREAAHIGEPATRSDSQSELQERERER